MEFPAVAVMAVCFFLSDRTGSITALVFLALWEIHYLNRDLIFPFRLGAGARPLPILVVLLAIVFNLLNGYLNGRYLFSLGPDRETGWLWDPRFLAGAAIMAAGFGINQHADAVLRRLRQPPETGYRIPRGGLYRFISCPNYFGEILEWAGWSLATWSLPGLAFLVWTVANLAPRALSHHRWYQATFPDYPKERRALLPFVL
jgi:protein-S-isoprenylcysteine O-methyltransferase Ste14